MTRYVRNDGIIIYLQKDAGKPDVLECRFCPVLDSKNGCKISEKLRQRTDDCEFNLTAGQAQEIAADPFQMQRFLKEIGR